MEFKLSIRFLSFCIPIFIFSGCSSEKKLDPIIGQWEVVEMQSLGVKMNLAALEAERWIQFKTNGTYLIGEKDKTYGKWEVRGDKLVLNQPGITDLNDRLVSKPYQTEWIFYLSSKYMVWKGTHTNHTQTLKLVLSKIEDQSLVQHTR